MIFWAIWVSLRSHKCVWWVSTARIPTSFKTGAWRQAGMSFLHRLLLHYWSCRNISATKLSAGFDGADTYQAHKIGFCHWHWFYQIAFSCKDWLAVQGLPLQYRAWGTPAVSSWSCCGLAEDKARFCTFSVGVINQYETLPKITECSLYESQARFLPTVWLFFSF